VKTPEDYRREIVERGERRLPPVFALARGRKNGAAATAAAAIRSAPATGMGGATGVPLATGLGVLHGVLGHRCGVFAPEAIVDPIAFFDALAPLCDPVCEGAGDLAVVTRSWEPTDLATLLAKD
jgi:hypothetical protein